MDRVDCIVIGAGVVGLAVARELALAGREVLILEALERFGAVTSSRNSEVIHAGLYYAPGSLKAGLCVAGRPLLYSYCAARGVAHRRTGKLIVATEPGQIAKLDTIAANAKACGVDDLRRLSRAEALALEPALRCEAALLSPATGIVDAHGLMTAYLGDAEAAGAQLVLKTEVIGGACSADSPVIRTRAADGGEFDLMARSVVNAAGLGAQEIARGLAGFPLHLVPRRHLARGCYFALAGPSPFRRLVYPVPVDGGLGVHLTLDLAGQARFGPDVEWVDDIDYTVDPRRADSFHGEIRRYWPALADGQLVAAYAGLRPKLSGPGEAAADFVIQGPKQHGVTGLVNLFGIESPGLTASLAIAQAVAEALSA